MVFLATLLVAAPFAHAQEGHGVRAGLSTNPDQFYLGAHAAAGPVLPRLWFRPNLELGLGDNRTVVALNAKLTYWVPLDASLWNLYIGGGPALNLIRGPRRRPFDERETRAEGGLNVLIGFGHQRGFFTELKVGAFDSPEVKFGFGYFFR